jgi:hypothetical protein
VSLAQSPDRKTGQPGPTREDVYLDPVEKGSGEEQDEMLLPGKTRFGRELLMDSFQKESLKA